MKNEEAARYELPSPQSAGDGARTDKHSEMVKRKPLKQSNGVAKLDENSLNAGMPENNQRQNPEQLGEIESPSIPAVEV